MYSVGWNLTLEYAISASAVAGGWSQYLAAAFRRYDIPSTMNTIISLIYNSVGHPLPEWLIDYKVHIGSLEFSIYFMSAVIVVLCTAGEHAIMSRHVSWMSI